MVTFTPDFFFCFIFLLLCNFDSWAFYLNWDKKGFWLKWPHGWISSPQYAGTWYAVAKKDPEGLFLIDNIVAQFSIAEDGAMTATAKGRVVILK